MAVALQKRIYRCLLVGAVSFVFSSCSLLVKKVNFNKEETEFLNVYNENDTLIFKNLTSNLIDTVVITSKRIYHEYDPVRHDYNVHCVNIDYTSTRFV